MELTITEVSGVFSLMYDTKLISSSTERQTLLNVIEDIGTVDASAYIDASDVKAGPLFVITKSQLNTMKEVDIVAFGLSVDADVNISYSKSKNVQNILNLLQ